MYDDLDFAATGMPGLLRGLIDPDPEVRGVSLDAMRNVGDLDRMLATVPFLLEVLRTPGVPGRDGIAELLASIGAAGNWPFEVAGDDDEFGATVARIGRARQLIAGGDLLGLAADPDPWLRAAMPPLLTIREDDPRVAEVFTSRFDVETDGDARRALLDGLGRIAARTGDAGIVAYLLGVAAAAPEASVAAAALIAAARADPALVPVTGAAGLLERAYAEPAGFTTETMTGAVPEGRRAPHAARMIDGLTDALGPRVADRGAILRELLGSPHADVHGDALLGAITLVERWRGEHAEVIRAIGRRLSHPDPRVVGHTAVTLRCWAPLTAVVAEPVAAALSTLDALPWRDGLPTWTVPSRSEPPGLHPTLEVLARLADERALPMLLTTLELRQRPRDSGYLLARYPRHAERIVAAMLPVLSAPRAAGRHGIHVALQAFGVAAAPAVPWLLAAPLDDDAATTLGRIGPAAAEAVPALRAAATGDDARLAVAAAGALWRIEGSPAVLPLLAAHIDGPWGTAALAAIAELGAAAADAAPVVATVLGAPDGDRWRPMHAAVALWRITGDADRTAPVLTAAWHGNPHTRNAIVAALAGPGALTAGPLAAALEPLLRAESADPRRYGARERGWSSNQVTNDERLLAACRAALAGTGGVPA
ncbi:hypothetical protein OHA72_40070 [Dactylosporangium sp. NBC_01737]|uniref:hypothetical protein n=1 Tax=Dactylosporangium sp. NBC_01737 TaxID=2975959 RepID=UPI002E0F665C|nr:hypothetical protein OHA72_40070 [Dactylosporangium sp. NBC_01737]